MLAGIFTSIWSWLNTHLWQPLVDFGPHLAVAAVTGLTVYTIARVVFALTARSKGNR